MRVTSKIISDYPITLNKKKNKNKKRGKNRGKEKRKA